MLGETDLKDFFAEPRNPQSQQNTVKCRYKPCFRLVHPHIPCDIKIIQCSLPKGHTKK